MSDSKATAIKIGWKDTLLTLLFGVIGYVVTYAVSLLPILETFRNGQYAWLQVPLGALLGAALKGLDRKTHEDPTTDRTGLIQV